MLKIAIESEALPEGQLCTNCGFIKATYRCLHCGPRCYFCLQCYEAVHMDTNLFHTGEIWENGVFKLVKKIRKIDVRSHHECSSLTWVPVCCIGENGDEYDVRLATCACEPLVLTLVRARLWPSAPQRPHIAFSFGLLDWMEALLLEAQRRAIYSSLIDAFEEYRWMKVELRQLTSICPDLDSGNVCPACPKESGTIVLSMDALFGLPRKKAAGISHRDPLHGDIFFGDQAAVDEYVTMYKMPRQKEPKVCNSFLAGDSLRSCRRYNKLDETAVFGCACRHEFPLFFLNLKHGERWVLCTLCISSLQGIHAHRLSYVVWLLEELVCRISSGVHTYIMYDVVCTLVQHLEGSATGEHLLEIFNYALPSFHAFGHNAACQAIYSPVHCEGIGLSDGEVMERLWSYLRRFSRMTKEMRPAHRIDILTHALLYYGLESKQKLPYLLRNRLKKAFAMSDMARQTFESLCGSLSAVPVTDDIVEEWVEVFKRAMTSEMNEKLLLPAWKHSYFIILQAYYIAREDPHRCCDKAVSSKRLQVLSLDNKLCEMEKKFGVPIRWKPTDQEYTEAKSLLLKEKKVHIHNTLWSSIVRRHYLLRMKAKYADGQKIAKKLCSNITKETKVTKRLFEEYNSAVYELASDDPAVSLQDVLSPKSEFWTQSSPALPDTSIPWKTKEEVIQSFLLMKRCEEEKEMLKSEMIATIQYWFQQITCVNIKIQELDACSAKDQYNRGSRSLLERVKLDMQLQHQRAVASFTEFVQLPQSILTDISGSDVDAVDVDVSDDSDTSASDSEDEDVENADLF